MRRAALLMGIVVLVAACGAGEEPLPTLPPDATQAPGGPATSRPVTTSSVTTSPVTTSPVTPSAIGGGFPEPIDGVVDRWTVEVLETRPHDATAFTQGLVLAGGALWESTGRYGESEIRRVDPATGEVPAAAPLDDDQFGEGLAMVDGRLVQLTWREEVALVWDPATLEEVGRFSYRGEGWGLCDDGDRLVMSDGSAELTFRDRETFAAASAVEVTFDGAPVERLNELECVDGLVFANVWKTAEIVVIEPTTGEVTAVIDAGPLLPEGLDSDAVLNGIAHDAERASFLVTGKLWPVLYEVRFVDG